MLTIRKLLFAALTGLAVSARGEAVPDKPGSVSMSVSWSEVKAIDQPFSPEQTIVNVVYTLDGKEVSDTIPIDADTSLWKGSDQPTGAGGALVLRDAAYSRALIRLDLSRIPKEAQIVKASLHFKVAWVQNKGEAGAFSCSRILTPWTEDATWVKARPSDTAPWNGLQAGKDYEQKPFTSITQPNLQKAVSVVDIPGLEEAIRQWRNGAWPNNGFLLAFYGKAIQVTIPSREGVSPTRPLTIGGKSGSKVILAPNFPLLARILLKPDDLLGAQAAITVIPPKAKADNTGNVNLYETEALQGAPGKLLASVPLKDVQKGPFILPDFAPALRAWMTSGTGRALLLAVEGANGAPGGELMLNGEANIHRPLLNITLRDSPAAKVFGETAIRPKAGVYARVVGGHITYDGARLRLWGVVGHPRPDRLVKMGFNAERIWAPNGADCYTPESGKLGEFLTYQKGDGSKFDLADKHFAETKADGLFVMFAALTAMIPTDLVTQDGSFISGGSDWTQWKAAIQIKGGAAPQQYIFVDERLQQVRKRHAKNILTHVNPYTGKAYGADEAIAIYEIFNEDGFLEKTMDGGLEKWAPYFKDKLRKKWNEWLLKRYTSDDGIRKAWGSLKQGESASGGSVELAPEFAARLSYPEKRADDFVEFALELENSFNQDFRSYCRSLFPAGIGVNVAGFSFDTMYRPNLPWAYGQSLGDVHSDGMYFWAIPSTLDKPPSAYVIDSFTPAGMPTVLYETNQGRPSPYRSEYPLKVAAIASRQDWDGVFWHYWPASGGEHDVEYLRGTMPYPNNPFYWTGVENTLDPVMCGAMAMGGRIFLGQKIPPAENPETVKVGKKALFSYADFRGINVATATLSKGSRIQYSPKDDSGVSVDGKPVPIAGRLEKALSAGSYVTWDWPNGRLIIDAPTVKAYVGKVAGAFQFSDGITLTGVSTPWICFSLVSADDKPLTGPDATKRAFMSGLFDAKNTGFSFDYSAQGGPVEQARAIRSPGHEPVQVDKVEYKVLFPNQLDGVLKSYDFALRTTKTTDVSSNEVAQTGETPFVDTLDIKSRGASVTLPGAGPTRIDKVDYADITKAGAASAIAGQETAGAGFPLPAGDWTMDYSSSHKAIRDSPLIFTSISKEDPAANADGIITLTDAQLPGLWNSVADVALAFHQDKMASVEVTFKQPPSVNEVIGLFTQARGEPVLKKIQSQEGTTEIHWPAQKDLPDVFVTESQGIMKIIYQAPGRKP